MANKKYDDQLKKDVIEAVLEGHRSAAQVAKDYDVPKTAVYSWIRAYKQEHDLAVLPLKNETPEQQIQWHNSRRHCHIHMQSPHHPSHCIPLGLYFATKSFIKAFAV